MSWVGLADANGAEFDLTGLITRARPSAYKLKERPDALACRGTIMVEADVAQFTVPRPLIDHRLGAGFRLDMAFGTEDMLDFTLTIGEQTWQARLPLLITDTLHPVRITYAWDAAIKAAVLSIYQPRSHHTAQTLLQSPRPIPWAVLRGLVHDAPEMCRSNEVTFVAISRGFEPAGAMPGFGGRTPIATPDGPREVARISAGDTVLTVDGNPVQVLRRVHRLLPARGSFTPFNLRAPYLGLDRDLTLAGETLVQLEGSDVEYLLGIERVLAQVNQLGEGKAAPLRGDRATIVYHQLVLDKVEILEAGVGLGSFNLSASEPDSVSAATTLWADLKGSMPTGHGPEPYPVARPYEIVTLNASRAA